MNLLSYHEMNKPTQVGWALFWLVVMGFGLLLT